MLKIVWHELSEGKTQSFRKYIEKLEDLDENHDLQRLRTPGQKQERRHEHGHPTDMTQRRVRRGGHQKTSKVIPPASSYLLDG